MFYNRDSRRLSRFIKEDSVDFIVFSPPYWNLRDYGHEKQIGHKQPYDALPGRYEESVFECYKVLKPSGFMAINIGTVVSNEGMKFLSGDFVVLL